MGIPFEPPSDAVGRPADRLHRERRGSQMSELKALWNPRAPGNQRCVRRIAPECTTDEEYWALGKRAKKPKPTCRRFNSRSVRRIRYSDDSHEAQLIRSKLRGEVVLRQAKQGDADVPRD